MTNRSKRRLTLALVGVASLLFTLAGPPVLLAAEGAAPAARKIDFNREIRPILSETCFQCHGPDAAKRKADLRLDLADAAKAGRDGHFAIVAGKPESSDVVARITSADPDEQMPPPDSALKLTAAEIKLITEWIAQGAEYQPHWAFIPVQRPPLPPLATLDRPTNAIDNFVHARLKLEGLTFSPPADKVTLLRRVSLDLTGLPPTPDEVDAFLSDESSVAYEKVVDRLLASPRYGERMAVAWLDAARYADTNGYQSDAERHMWRWRDWVIDAFNRNMPFDQFTTEQLAGDLLPQPKLDQLIATGFNRNHRGNAEGGIIPEEYLVEYAVDRVDTTATVWLGLTIGCARCHDHKFDPITQKNFYEMFAYFNNLPERGRVVRLGNSPPLVKSPTPEQQQQQTDLAARLATAESELTRVEQELVAGQAAWEKSLAGQADVDWAPDRGLVLYYPLDGKLSATVEVAPPPKTGKESAPATNSKEPPPVAAEPSFVDGDPAFASGRLGQGVDLNGRRFVELGNVADYGELDKFSYSLWVYPRGTRTGAVLARMDDEDINTGFELYLDAGRVHVNFVNRWLDDCIRLEANEPLSPDQWHHVAVSYDGKMTSQGVKIYIDGKLQAFKIHFDLFNNSFKVKQPLRLGARTTTARLDGLIDEVRFYNYPLPPAVVAALSCADSVTAIAAIPPAQRTPQQADKIRLYYIAQAAPEQIRKAHDLAIQLRQQSIDLDDSIQTTMIMQDRPDPRETFILVRGEYDKPGERVAAGVPRNIAPLPADAPPNRLGLAKWLLDPAHPLTSRVAVNRYWQMLFGTGLVKSAEDFGAQGERPVHPELLDWLAAEFMASGWNVKAMQKQMVMSATYRQSSRPRPEMAQRDPDNRLLARGPRYRMPAEMIRDQALLASGLLVEKIGGPSVRPYQPPGLWEELNTQTYEPDQGPSLYRRSLYTFWKRTIAPPSMMAFDAASREMCVVRQSRTNTPLQALALMNDVTYIEAARVLAQRVMGQSGSVDDRLVAAFRRIVARPPTAKELAVLHAGFDRRLAQFKAQPESATKLVSYGASPRDDKFDCCELAAYTTAISVIFNLDEAITKE